MMALQNQRAAAASHSNTATLESDSQTEQVHPSPEPPTRLDLLRQQFHQMGLGLYQVNGGDELTVTGPGASGAALPDMRSAAIYLRELRRGTHG